MSIEAEQAVGSELAPDEHLLWSGMPRQGFRLQAIDLFLVPFSVMWCGGAIFWEVSAVSVRAPFFFKLWGIPFVLFGLYFVVGRFFVDKWQRARAWYGLTDRRILIVTDWRARSLKTLSLRGLNDIALRERKDRRGTLTFGPTPWMFSGSFGAWWPGMSGRLPPSFDDVADVRKVYELIRDVRDRQPGHAARVGPTGLPNLDSLRG